MTRPSLTSWPEEYGYEIEDEDCWCDGEEDEEAGECLEELSTLCNNNITSSGDDTSQCPNYIFETTYWLGNVYGGYNVWTVNVDGLVGYDNYDDSLGYNGVRPVISITLN